MIFVVGIAFAFLAMTFAVWTVFRRSGMDAYARIALYWSGDGPPAEEAEKEQSFTERLILPFFTNASKAAGTMLPRSWLDRIDRKILYAGNPMQLTADRFVMICAVTGLGLPGAYFVLALTSGRLDKMGLILIGVMVGIGFYLPWFWLSTRVKRRQSSIGDMLPDAMDLLTVSVEAGLGLEGALARVSDKLGGPLSEELQRMLADMSLGTRRRDALRKLASRTNAPGLDTLVGALIQADQMGISLGTVLRAQADQLRQKRRQIAEEKAMKAPLKILFPMVVFILPTVFIVVLTPALMRMIEGLKGNGVF